MQVVNHGWSSVGYLLLSVPKKSRWFALVANGRGSPFSVFRFLLRKKDSPQNGTGHPAKGAEKHAEKRGYAVVIVCPPPPALGGAWDAESDNLKRGFPS